MATPSNTSGKGNSTRTSNKGTSAPAPAAPLVTVQAPPAATPQTQLPVPPASTQASNTAPAGSNVQAPTLAPGTSPVALPVVPTGKGSTLPSVTLATPGSKLAALQAAAAANGTTAPACVRKARTHNCIKAGTPAYAAGLALLRYLASNGHTSAATAISNAQLAKLVAWPHNPGRVVQNGGYNARHCSANFAANTPAWCMQIGTGNSALVYITPAGQQLLAPAAPATQAS